MKPETRLWNRMRPHIVQSCFVQRIENLVGEGVPDVILHLRDNGSCAFLELKCRLLLPVKSSTPIFKGQHGLRPDQVAWIYERARVGANVWILGQGGDRIWLVHGCSARSLDGWTIADLNSRCCWSGAARKTDWEGMLKVVYAR